jgi:RNA polymerase sigma-70 factor (ECF subfamily)
MAEISSEQYDELREMTDEELMQQFQSGVVAAYEILVDRYEEPLKHYIYRFVNQWEKAEDLLQEAFMRVHRNRHSYQPIAKFSTWLYTIAGNLARSEYRKGKRRNTHSIHRVNRDNEEYDMDLPDETFSPDTAAESSLQDEYIQEALMEIPETFREVVVLRDIQQLTYKEIAEITGLPLGTVKSRINRGRNKLQDLLDEVYGPEEKS